MVGQQRQPTPGQNLPVWSANGERHQIGIVGGFISEWWAISNRNRGRLHPGNLACNRTPHLVAADAAFYSRENDAQARAMCVKRVPPTALHADVSRRNGGSVTDKNGAPDGKDGQEDMLRQTAPTETVAPFLRRRCVWSTRGLLARHCSRRGSSPHQDHRFPERRSRQGAGPAMPKRAPGRARPYLSGRDLPEALSQSRSPHGRTQFVVGTLDQDFHPLERLQGGDAPST